MFDECAIAYPELAIGILAQIENNQKQRFWLTWKNVEELTMKVPNERQNIHYYPTEQQIRKMIWDIGMCFKEFNYEFDG